MFRVRSVLLGLVADNIDSWTLVDSVDEIDRAGERLKIESRRIVSYGVAVLMHPLDDWLNSRVISSSASVERSKRQRDSQ